MSKKCPLRWRTDEPLQTDQTRLQPNSVVATPCWNPEHAIRTRRAVPWNCAHPQQPPVHRLELMSRNCSIDHIYFRYIFQNFFRTQKSNIFLQISELGGGFFCAEKERALYCFKLSFEGLVSLRSCSANIGIRSTTVSHKTAAFSKPVHNFVLVIGI